MDSQSTAPARVLLRRPLMQAIIGADDAAKRAGLRSQRGPDSKDVLLKCNGAVSKVGNSEQPPGRPLKPGGGGGDDDDDDGYWQLLLHAKCHARFYTAPPTPMVPPPKAASAWLGWPMVRMPPVARAGSCAARLRL